MIFSSPNDAYEPSLHANHPLLALSLFLAAALLGCGEQVIVGREVAMPPSAEALLDSDAGSAQTPRSLDGGNDDDESDGDESDGDDDDIDDDGINDDEADPDD